MAGYPWNHGDVLTAMDLNAAIMLGFSGQSAAFVSATPPPSPLPGQMWFDPVGAQTYVWYNDGTSSQWVVAVNPPAGNFLPLSGGQLAGPLLLGADGTHPTNVNSAVSKAYVDRATNAILGVLHLTDFVQSGDTDDTPALGRMVAAWSANPGGGAMLFPIRRETNLSSGVTINIAQGQALVLGADGAGDARLRFASTFTGTAFTITESASTSHAEGPLVRVQGLTFISTWSAVSGQGFAITAGSSGNVAPSPSCIIRDLRFQNDGTGSWQQGGSLFAMNVTKVFNVTCFGFTGSSIGLSYDTDTRISVEHEIEDFYMNGGGTGLLLGHTGATGPLQGFTIRRPSFTGCTNGIVATCASNLDQILVTDAQINTPNTGVSLTNVTTPIISSNYFLDCGTAIKATGGVRVIISDNAFYLGSPTAYPGDGTNNLAIVLNNLGGTPDAGSVVSDNLFTNVYGSVACVQLTGFTNYVHSTGNMALQGSVVSDTTGSPNNTDFGNYAAGGINSISLGSGTTKPSIAVSVGNLTLTAPAGNVLVNGTLGLTGSGATSFLHTESAGDILVNTQNLKLATRPTFADTPQLVFAYNTTGTANPSLGYNPTISDFVFTNENGAVSATLDVNGNFRAYAGFTVNNGGPTIRSGTGAATGTQPKGSLWMRTDGAAGTTLYVSQGGGTWNAVAGV